MFALPDQAVEQKTRPILFSGLMVNAILEGRKVVTRRAVTVPWAKGKRCAPYEPYYIEDDGRLLWMDEAGDYHAMERISPYGFAGDHLYVRETFAYVNAGSPDQEIAYEADCGACLYNEHGLVGTGYYLGSNFQPVTGWKPGIHMPRWASRITLKIEDVRVERLQRITTDDVWAEGVQIPTTTGSVLWRLTSNRAGKCPASYLPPGRLFPDQPPCTVDEIARAHFADLWDNINHKRGYGWDTNPWVWRIAFRRIP